MAAAFCLAACGSAHPRVPASWRAVDACLERRPAFAGKVRANDHRGPVGQGELVLAVAERRFAQAYRFPSHQAALAGAGPHGGVEYYGPIALLVSSETRGDEAYVKGCFARVYGSAKVRSQ